MAKLILSLDGAHLNEYPLIKERTSIGRRSSNDIQLDNLAISGAHAAVVKVGKDFYIEDLDSTNGTLVNNEATKKRLLQHGDEIELGKFRLKYLDDAAANENADDSSAPVFEKTMLIHPSALKSNKARPLVESPSVAAPAAEQASNQPEDSAPAAAKPADTAMASKVGRIQVLNGTNSGRELVLNKTLTTLGKTGVQVAVITKRPHGYFIAHVEGQILPIVNGVSAGTQAVALNDHDVIELAGVKMEFYLAAS